MVEAPRRGLVAAVGRVVGTLVAWVVWGRNAASLASLRELVTGPGAEGARR